MCIICISTCLYVFGYIFKFLKKDNLNTKCLFSSCRVLSSLLFSSYSLISLKNIFHIHVPSKKCIFYWKSNVHIIFYNIIFFFNSLLFLYLSTKINKSQSHKYNTNKCNCLCICSICICVRAIYIHHVIYIFLRTFILRDFKCPTGFGKNIPSTNFVYILKGHFSKKV